MSKHTKGPWTCSPVSSIVGSLIRSADLNIAAVMPQVDKSECEANARLIAKAPDLLASCQAVLATIEQAVNAGFRLPGPLLDALDGMRALVEASK